MNNFFFRFIFRFVYFIFLFWSALARTVTAAQVIAEAYAQPAAQCVYITAHLNFELKHGMEKGVFLSEVHLDYLLWPTYYSLLSDQCCQDRFYPHWNLFPSLSMARELFSVFLLWPKNHIFLSKLVSSPIPLNLLTTKNWYLKNKQHELSFRI